MSKKIEVECYNCGIKFERNKGEVKRSIKLGRRNFCSPGCSALVGNKERESYAQTIRTNETSQINGKSLGIPFIGGNK